MFFRLLKKQKTKKVLFLLVFLKPFFFFLILDFVHRCGKKCKITHQKPKLLILLFFDVVPKDSR